jgi:hypothetical protein
MDLTGLFCNVDDFVNQQSTAKSLSITDNRIHRARKFKLSDSEIMTICIAYHQSGYKNFKAFYLEYVCKYLKTQFPDLVSYNRFVELMSKVSNLLSDYLIFRLDKPTGISYIDSTPIQVCKPKRMSRNKVFKDTGKKSKSTIGWFFGFKLHIIINEIGGLLSVKFTKGNVNDCSPVLEMAKNLFGKLFGDKGYISKELSEKLLENNVQLITGIRKNMKNKLMPLIDKILLRKRSIIETVNDQLKNISDIEHSRHRSIKNFLINILCSLIAYTHQDKKPSITGINNEMLAFI